MRKIVALVLFVCLLTCAGCSAKSVNAALRGISFSFTCENNSGSTEIAASVNQNGDMLFKVCSGRAEGLSLSFSEDGIKTEFCGVSEVFPSGTDFGIMSDMYEAFLGLHNTTAEYSSGEYTVFNSELDATLIVTELGLPIKLTLKGSEISFNNIKVE